MKKYVKLLRFKHYIKNLLIFLPLVFGKKLFDLEILFHMLSGFVSFCAISSAVYIYNDICDAELDKKHPTKRTRPIANGSVTKKTAWLLIVIMLIICITTNLVFCQNNYVSWLLLFIYLIQNFLYSIKLKAIPIIDIAILASGFLIRVFYGYTISGIAVSNWLYLTVIAISFYLVLGKRRNELAITETNETRKVLRYYSYSFLDKNMYICSALTIVFYSLWSVDPITIDFFQSKAMVWTVPIVILICMLYSLSVEKSGEGDPVDVLFSNKPLLILIAIYGLAVISIIYLR